MDDKHFDKKVWQMNRSAKKLLLIWMVSVANRCWFTKLPIFPCQTFLLYGTLLLKLSLKVLKIFSGEMQSVYWKWSWLKQLANEQLFLIWYNVLVTCQNEEQASIGNTEKLIVSTNWKRWDPSSLLTSRKYS